MQKDDDTWAEWSKHVILSIERLSNDIDKLDVKISLVHNKVIQLRTRSAIIWSVLGATGGALLTLCMLLILKVV